MDVIIKLLDIFVHLDVYLSIILSNYGFWTYAILFVVIFIETGLVVMPFLPGDSLIFAAGTFAALGSLNIYFLAFILMVAAILGDTVNYWIGNLLAVRVKNGEIKWIRKEYMDRTHKFFEKHGGKTIFLARFVPIIRTFAPFVAGVGNMAYSYFISYNFIGGITWVALFTCAGYFFGNIPFIKNNFSLVILAIVIISILPAVIEALRSTIAQKKEIKVK